MAAMFGSQSNAKQQTTYTGVPIQTSTAGVVIAILWGVNRIGHNIIDLNDFSQSGGGSKGGKGGGGGKGGTKDYRTSCILALCEGPVSPTDVTVWQNASLLSTASSLNLTLFAGEIGQAPAAWMVSNHPDKALGYTETAYFFSSSFDLGGSPNLPNLNFEVFGKFASFSGSPDVNFALIVNDFFTSPQYGVDPGATYIDPASWQNYYNYCQAFTLWGSPCLHTQEQGTSILQRWAQLTNTWIFWSGDRMKFVPLGDTEGIGNGATYIPNLSPIYDIGTDDLIFDASSEDPVIVDRIDPADGYNNVEIDIRDRALQYASNPIRWQDQSSVDQYGLLQSQTVNAEEICDANIGAMMAQLIGKRCTYIRNSYTFKLGPNFLLLEPGDIVTLTEPNSGLLRFPVRITEVDEDDKGTLTFKAEELPDAIGTATLYTPQLGLPTAPPDINIDPGNINAPPAILEPSPVFTNGAAQIWLAASGGADWGGCNVYVSADGTHYALIGQITEASQQGVLTGALADAAGLDTVNTLAVDTTESGLPLSADVADADADFFRTASMVGGEMLAYGHAVNTSTFGASLTYLRRGIYGTAHAAHGIGAPFTRLNPAATLIYPLPQEYVGQPLWFKFPSFNIFGRGTQAISAVPAYTFTPAGPAFAIAPPTSPTLVPSRVVQADGTVLLTMTAAWAASLGPMVGSYEVQFSADGGTTWPIDVNPGAGALAYALVPALAATNYQARVRAVSQSGLATSSWASSAIVNSGALVGSVPTAPTGVSAIADGSDALVSYALLADPTVFAYQIWRASGAGAFGGAALVQSNGLADSWLDPTTAPTTEYTYFLVAVNAAGSSLPSLGSTVVTGAAASGGSGAMLPLMNGDTSPSGVIVTPSGQAIGVRV